MRLFTGLDFSFRSICTSLPAGKVLSGFLVIIFLRRRTTKSRREICDSVGLSRFEFIFQLGSFRIVYFDSKMYVSVKDVSPRFEDSSLIVI